MNKERDYFFDNLKAVLIFLVVLGHFLLPIHGESVLVVVKRLIYVFHMPLFVFVSGYFAKKIYKNGQYNFKKILYLIKAYIIFVIAIQIVYALCGFRDFSEINFFSQSGAPWYLFAMIVWYLTIPVIRKYKEIPVLIVTVALALIAGYFKNIGDFLCMSRILVFGPFFYLGYYMEQPVLERALRPVYRRVVVPAAVAICAGILAFGSKLKDELGMVYENISYYELDDVWEGPFVRLALMIAAFLISWAIMFFVPRGKTCLSVIGQNTMPVYMLHRILRDILMFAGLIATFLYDACAAALRALGDTITPLVILAISVILNIAGDLFFVVVLKTGVRGAAVATVSAQALAFVICWIYMIKRYELLRLSGDDFKEPQPQMIQSMLSAGLSMGFMSSLINIGSLTLQTAINKLGQNIIVAHTAARKISEMFMIMFTVFGQTMATYCGQNLGAGRIDRIKKGIGLAILYTCIWCSFTIVASYTIGDWLVYMVTGSKNAEVLKNATNYLKFDTLFYFVTAVICVVRNAMQGLGDHITPLVSSSLEMIGKIVIAATLVPWFGYTGVIVAEPLVWFIMVIPLLIQIFRMPVLKNNILTKS